jgi:hypothetical protein
MPEIAYSVPQVGPVNIQLYPPADEVYALLEAVGEISRLTGLKHIGALDYAFPGVSHSRWDYTVSMLYVVTRLRRLVTNSQFVMGAKTFSSMTAALQCLALLSNVGHLPGTYCAEKGVARFLLGRNEGSPLDCLFEAAMDNDLGVIRQLIEGANELLKKKDYLALNRLCAIVKLITNFAGRAAVPRWLVYDLFVPFVLRDLRPAHPRWSELDQYFDASRRLAYLNRDTALIDSPITVGLSPLLSNLVDPEGLTKEALLQSQEITSAYEHTVYERFYHLPEARKVTAVVAASVLARLRTEGDAAARITEWMYDNDMDEVIDPETTRQRLRDANLIGTVSLRTFFFSLSGTASKIERNLEGLLGQDEGVQVRTAVGVCEYDPPDSQHTLVPDQTYLDALTLGEVDSQQVGLLLKWIADDLDSSYHDPADFYAWFVKPDISEIYEALLGQLIAVAWPDVHLEIKAWPLSRLGKFKTRDDERGEIPIWHASSALDDKFTKHIVRDISTVPPALTSIRDELRGLSQLRAQLRKGWSGNRARPRKRHFLITASIRLSKPAEKGTEREFDGGLLQLSSRMGCARLYLLETKGAQTSSAAANRLRQKLEALDLRGNVTRLKSRSAYVAFEL